MKSKLERVEQEIRKRVEVALEEGYLLRPGGIAGGPPYRNGAHVCLLGLLNLNSKRSVSGLYQERQRNSAGELLGLTAVEVRALEAGFEGWCQYGDEPEWCYSEWCYWIGDTIRQDYYETFWPASVDG